MNEMAYVYMSFFKSYKCENYCITTDRKECVNLLLSNN